MTPTAPHSRTAAQAIATLFVALASACCASTSPPTPTPPPANLSLEDTRVAYNQRVERLATLNTRGIIVFEYIDEHGERTKDQGDLNLRIQRPNNLALVIKKLGETYIWLGANADRYWLVNRLSEPSTAVIGRHDQLTRPKADALTLPLPPRQLLHLLALEPIPPDATLAWDRATGLEIVSFPADNAFARTAAPDARWRLAIDTNTKRPAAITLLDANASTIAHADLDTPKEVRTTAPVRADQPPDPITPARITVTRPRTGESVRIIMDGLTDRPSNPAIFRLETAINTLEPERVIDIDRDPAADRPQDAP